MAAAAAASKQRLEAGGRLVLVIGMMMMLMTSTSAATTTDADGNAAAAGGAPLRLSAGSTSAEVAQDGRPGSYPTIAQALENAPTDKNSDHVVFIRKGTYPETLTITRPNVRLVGDGIGLTIITGNHCKGTGHDTASSATVSVLGEGFMAQDLTIENTAGVDAGQAVALRSSSHKSVCYRCELRGFQDTLWADAGDQFYRSCIITGTVDFIFGNARALFQDTKVHVRRPPPGGHSVVTAQGRDGPDHRSGFVFQGCSVAAAAQDPAGAGTTFLGRPWRNHSHVVFVDSFLDDVVNSQGWEQWNLTSKVPHTVYYGEFQNRGPGADTTGRVRWPAFHLLHAAEAANFTVSAFIQGQEWIPRFNNVPYY